MPALTRRRYTEYRDECWHIYYGDVHVGTIAILTGIPHDEDPWGEFFDSHDPEGSYVHRRHIDAARATDGIRR